MAYVVIAEGDPEYMRENPQYSQELPHGTSIRMEFETAPGLAYMADIWGAEWVIEKFLTEGVQITNAYSEGSSKVIAEGYVDSPGAVIIVGLILTCLAIAGIAYIIKQIRVLAEIVSLPEFPEIPEELVWALLALGAVAIVAIAIPLTRRR